MLKVFEVLSQSIIEHYDDLVIQGTPSNLGHITNLENTKHFSM
jgi:hypothetical protein